MQWSGIPDDLYYNAWDKSIWKILRTSQKEGIFVFFESKLCKTNTPTWRFDPEQTSNNSVRFVLKKSKLKIKYSSCWYGLMHRSGKKSYEKEVDVLNPTERSRI